VNQVSLDWFIDAENLFHSQDLATLPRPEDLEGFIKAQMWDAGY